MVNGWMDGWMDGRTDGWMDVWMDGLTDGRDRRTDNGQMGGQTDQCNEDGRMATYIGQK